MQTFLLILALGCWSATSPRAQGTVGAGSRSLWEDLRHGKLLLSSYVQFEDDAEQKQFAFDLLVSQEIDLEFSPRQQLVAAFEYRVDNEDLTRGVIDDSVEQQERRYHLNLREAYHQVSFEKIDIFVGKKIWAWGTADGYNPTDNINPLDLTDFLVSDPVGVPGVGVVYSGIRTNLDLVLLPWFTPARLPGPGSRWAALPDPTDFLGPGTEGVLLLQGDRFLPERDGKNLQTAARLKLTLAGTDLAFSWFHGFDPVPAGIVTAFGSTPSSRSLDFVEVGRVYNEIDEYGLALASTLGELAVHAEMSYRVTADGHDEDFLTWVAGVNRSWYLGGRLEELRLTVEYVDEAFVRDNGQSDRLTSIFNRPLRDSLLGELVLGFGVDVSAGLAISYNTSANDHMLEPSFERSFGDKFKLKLGAQLIDGDPGTFWGNWSENDRFFTHFTYFF